MKLAKGFRLMSRRFDCVRDRVMRTGIAYPDSWSRRQRRRCRHWTGSDQNNGPIISDGLLVGSWSTWSGSKSWASVVPRPRWAGSADWWLSERGRKKPTSSHSVTEVQIAAALYAGLW